MPKRLIVLIICVLSFFMNHLFTQDDNFLEIATYWYYDIEVINGTEMEYITIEYYISEEEFSISVLSAEMIQEISLEIISYNQEEKQIKTKVLSVSGTYYEVKEGDFMFWKYWFDEEEWTAYFDFSTEEYPKEATTGPFWPPGPLTEEDYEEMGIEVDGM